MQNHVQFVMKHYTSSLQTCTELSYHARLICIIKLSEINLIHLKFMYVTTVHGLHIHT